MTRVIVCGCRDFNDYELLCDKMRDELNRYTEAS